MERHLHPLRQYLQSVVHAVRCPYDSCLRCWGDPRNQKLARSSIASRSLAMLALAGNLPMTLGFALEQPVWLAFGGTFVVLTILIWRRHRQRMVVLHERLRQAQIQLNPPK